MFGSSVFRNFCPLSPPISPFLEYRWIVVKCGVYVMLHPFMKFISFFFSRFPLPITPFPENQLNYVISFFIAMKIIHYFQYHLTMIPKWDVSGYSYNIFFWELVHEYFIVLSKIARLCPVKYAFMIFLLDCINCLQEEELRSYMKKSPAKKKARPTRKRRFEGD